ncbi:MAG: sigma-70 family RNA polymerase sigma factor [Planctomycetes bacterium]|nr:sigma-70 family RNA polymerase sigma factor [Planctomycetota bacterium]
MPTPEPGSSASFLTTRWSMVASLSARDEPRARSALSELCEQYWAPLYAFLRRRGLDAHEAADTVQGFFARLLEKRDFGELSAERGRFRAFLIAALRHHLAHERAREDAQKRGGAARVISLDPADADGHLHLPAAPGLTPEQAYEREWALSLLARALSAVQAEFAAAGKSDLFELLRPALQDPELAGVAAMAARSGLSEGAIRVAGSRLRKRYREVLRALVRDTVDSADDVDSELASLFEALAR